MTNRTMNRAHALALALLTGPAATQACHARPAPPKSHRHAPVTSAELLAAIGRGDITATADLLRRGANPNSADGDKRTALMYASMGGKIAIVKLLLRHGAYVNGRDAVGFTPLMAAMIGRSPATARVLVVHGADVKARNKPGSTALTMAMASHDLTTARLLFEYGYPVNLSSASGETALYQAALAGDEPFMKLFLAKHADVEAAANDGETPLMAAASEGKSGAVRLLLAHGAKVNAASQEGDTPLMLGAGSRSLETVRLLLNRGAKVNPRDNQGRTPLMHACAAPEPAIVSLLLARGADARAVDKNGGTALMRAASRGDAAVVKALLATGANPNAKDRQGLTALTRAEALHCDSVASVLKAAGAAGYQDARAARDARIRAAVTTSLSLIQHSAALFTDRTGGACFSCHHNGITAYAARAVRSAGFPIDETLMMREAAALRKGIDGPVKQAVPALKDPRALAELAKQDRDAGINSGYAMLAMEAHGLPADRNTDTMSRYLILRQEKDGRWTGPGFDMRRPAEHSDFTATALAVRSLRAYPPSGKQAEVDASFKRARTWLAAVTARTTEDRAFRLFGLVWSGGKSGDSDVQAAMESLLADQRTDGGWGQEAQLSPDAYATGEALVALHEAGVNTSDSRWSRGIDFLLRTQEEDGSWLVKSRAIPIQGYINSGFPHGRNQFISINGSCWATIALAASMPVQTASR